jgi:hypothetical protein
MINTRAWGVCLETAWRIHSRESSRSCRPAAPWLSVSFTIVSAFVAWLTGLALAPIPSPYRSNGPSHAASSLLASAREDGSKAVDRLVCSDQGTPLCLSAMT